jgi:preprotein translocase subunit SecY
MSKHEIRLRRQKLTSRGAERFRNYGAILERHEDEMRMKKIIRVFTYVLVIMIVIVLLVIVVRVERRLPVPKHPEQRTSVNFSVPPST